MPSRYPLSFMILFPLALAASLLSDGLYTWWLALAAILTLVPAAAMGCASWYRGTPVERTTLLALGGMLPLTLSTWTSSSPYSSWITLCTLGLLPMGYLWARYTPDVHRALALILPGATGVLGVWGLVEAHNTHMGPLGPFLDTNSFAAMLDMLTIACSGLLLNALRHKQGRKALWLLTAIGTGFAAMLTTQSRGAALTLALTAGVVVLLAWPNLSVRLRKAAAVAGGVLALVAIALFAKKTNLLLDASVTSREAMWQSTMGMFAAKPVFGWCLGTWFMHYPVWRLSGDTQSAGSYAHNDYLQFLAEGGVLLLGSLLLAAAATLITLKTRIAEKQWVAVGFAAAALTAFIHAGVNFVFYNAPLALLTGVLLAAAGQRVAPAGSTREVAPSIGTRVSAVALMAIALVSAGQLVLDAVASMAATAAADPQSSEARLMPQLATPAALYTLARLNPHYAGTAFALGSVLTRSATGPALANAPTAQLQHLEALYSAGLGWWETAQARDPLRGNAYLAEGFSLMHSAGKFPGYAKHVKDATRLMEADFRIALALDPLSPGAVLGLVTVLDHTGRSAEADTLIAEKQHLAYYEQQQRLFKELAARPRVPAVKQIGALAAH